METLLLEIGAEEIPAGYIDPALRALQSTLLNKLTEARIRHGQARTYGTPRRLTVMVDGVAPRQDALTSEVIGPPARISFDEQGKPTMAAVKFAEKVKVPVSRLSTTQTAKGSYLSARISDRGQATVMLLKTILPGVIQAVPFPKTMRWADYSLTFARPIHWVVALLGSRVVTVRLEGLKSGRYTRGHRFLHSGRIKVGQPAEYVSLLRQAKVMVDIDERRQAVLKEVDAIAADQGGRALSDEALLDTVTNLIEHPVVVAGHFDRKFLELPREILITSMREHQKYFAVVNDKDALMPCFIAVNNTQVNDLALVATGHERVLRARLEDARFFYQSDLKQPLDKYVEQLKGVMFQAKLGTVYDKVLRVQRLANALTQQLGLTADQQHQVDRAALLCKADLVSEVVGEFPNLQGIMGRVYSEHAGEPGDVAAAIEEHYRPTHSGGMLPQSVVGAVLAIADKMDSICGCFSVGLVPTGASDPYALRRQGIGIVQIIRDKGFVFSIQKLITASVAQFADLSTASQEALLERIYGFLRNRMSHQLAEEGFSKDVIAAVVSISADRVTDVWQRVQALETLKAQPDFEPLAIAFKRVVNIIRKAAAENAVPDAAVQPALFQDPCEARLLEAFQQVQGQLQGHLQNGDYGQALRTMAALRNPVDAFFEGVMVMADDAAVRANRLAQLNQIAGLFDQFADFSKIST